MPAARKRPKPCCPPKPPLTERPLLTPLQAAQLAQVFKTLANDSRLRLLHALARAGEVQVTELCTAAGLKPQAVSNQLQLMRAKGIVAARREGVTMIYRIIDPCVLELLDRGLCLSEDASGGAHR